MNVKIGAKIKELRKRDDITQEKLAEVLGVTSQAISKWESESGYPDIEYITPIANFFNVTIDHLFDHDTAEKRRKIDEYCKQYDASYERKWKPVEERIAMMRQALAEFPAEEKLLFRLADALHDKWRTPKKTMQIIEGQEVCVPYKEPDGWKEPAAIFEELLATSVDDSIRGKCRYYLAMIYGRADEKEKLIKIAERCDPVVRCREVLLANTLRDSKEYEMYHEEAILALVDSFDFIFKNLINTRGNLGKFYADEDDREDTRQEADELIIDIYAKINKLIFRNGNDDITRRIINLYRNYAANFILKLKIDKAFEVFDSAYKCAKNGDEHFYKKGEHNSDNFLKRLLPSLLEDLKEESSSITLPNDPQLCDDPRFIELINKIEADIENNKTIK